METRARGFTLVEIMVGMLILTIAFVSLSTVFSNISRSILVSRAKTVAANLAQEKIESLKNFSYYRLLVTTASNLNNPPATPIPDPNFPAIEYDIGTTPSYYPEEILNVGGIRFRRRVFVEFMKEETNQELTPQSWTGNDTGIKRVTVYVLWEEGGIWKKVELRNLRNNPDRAKKAFTFTGLVSSGTTGKVVYNALVDTAENSAYYARTDSGGTYTFSVSAGTYTLRVTATGYFTATSSQIVVNQDDTGSLTVNFNLTRKATGTVHGYAYTRNHLLITQVVASTDVNGSGEQEWVELYNPTTYEMLIASRPTSTSAWAVFFVTVTYIDNNNVEPPNNASKYLLAMTNVSGSTFAAFRSTSIHWTVDTTTIAIPAQSYFLIANRSTITFTTPSGFVQRIADAYYSVGGDVIHNDDLADFGCSANGWRGGGVRVTGSRGYAFNGRTDWHDGLAWQFYSGYGGCPALARESGAWCFAHYNTFHDWCADGVTKSLIGRTFWRHTIVFPTPTTPSNIVAASTINLRGTPPFAANCFDRNVTGEDFYAFRSDWYYPNDRNSSVNFYVSAGTYGVLNTDASMPCYSGTPAEGASVSASDGLSLSATVQSYGRFIIPDVATGSWRVTVASGNFIADYSTVIVTPNLSTWIPNGLTVPRWDFPASSTGFVTLTTATIYGYVSGQVTDKNGNPLRGASVSASGATPASINTDFRGWYRLNIDPTYSPVDVVASLAGYSNETYASVPIALGVSVSTINLSLLRAGSITGFITSNGTPSGALPGIPVTAVDESTTVTLGSTISGLDGKFLIPSVTTGAALVKLQLDSGEESTPGISRVVVYSISTGTWSSTFTVANAFGQIRGTVGIGITTNPITTGALVLATTIAMTTDSPPAINYGFRNLGTTVYYIASSDAAGNYAVSVRGGASYYIYSWYPKSLDVTTSSAPKRMAGTTFHYVAPGATITRDIRW